MKYKVLENKLLRIPLAVTAILLTVSCNNNAGGTGGSHQAPTAQQAKLKQQQKIAEMLQNNALWQQHLKVREHSLKENMEPIIHMGDGYDSRTGLGKGYNCLANYASKDNH